MRRICGLIVLGLALSGATGCNKMLANFSLNQATKRVDEAKVHQADTFDKEDLIATQDLINQTQQAINGQDFKGARLKGKEAATRAKELVEKTKSQRATFLKSESNKWINILDLNEGKAENPGLYAGVLQSNEQGLAAYDKQKWDQSIAAFDKAKTDANFLLENLKGKSEEGLKEIATLKDKLTKEGAPEHYPEAIIEIDDFRTRIEDLIVNKNDYRTALTTRDQARQAAETGIQKTKEIKSDKLLRQVESKLSNAVTLGAELYAPRTLTSVTEEFESLLKQFYEQKYDTVLTSGPGLVPKADNLIVETQRESARAKVDAVKQAIASLIEGKAKTYLPGRVEQLEQKLAEAQGLFDQNKYTDTEQVALKTLDDQKKVVDEFDGLAQKEITNASGELTIAESVFTRMEDIFAKRSPGKMSADDQSLEKGKEALREELRAKIRNSKLELGLATLKKDDKVFHEAIEVSKKVVGEANDIVQQTYRVVAHNAIQDISNELTRLEGEGGRDYAAAELDKSQKMIGETRTLLQQGSFRQAAERAAATQAEIEILNQSLARTAVRKIEEASNSIKVAEKAGAKDYQPDKLNKVQDFINHANSLLQGDNLKSAIETAEQARSLANQAGDEAIKQWAEEEMRKTDLTLQRARDAGAERYAPEMMQEAIDLRKNAQRLHDSGNMAEAQSIGSQAAATAEHALYAQVIEAEDAIARAKSSQGWEYEQQRLADAIISAKYAREFLDQGNYSLSTAHARQAATKAQNVTHDARIASFKDRMKSLQGKVDVAETKGAGFYQVHELSDIVGEMQKLGVEFEPAGYDQASEKIELMNAQLESLVSKTPDKLKELVDSMNEKLTALEGRGARSNTPDLVAEVSNKIKYSQLDFRNAQYHSSFQNAREGLALLGTIELRLNERDYDKKLNEYFTQLSRTIEKFGPVLNMGSPVMMRLIQGPTGRSQAVAMLSASNPTDFRQQVSDLAAQVALLQPPPTRRNIQNSSLEMLNAAKDGAAGFEKLLILDQYTPEQARDIVNSAFLHVSAARTQQQKIQQSLETPVSQVEQTGVKRAIETRR